MTLNVDEIDEPGVRAGFGAQRLVFLDDARAAPA